MIANEFIEYLNRGEVPPHAPDICSPGGHSYSWGQDFDEGLQGRSKATKHGMWAIVARSWTDRLAEWIGDRTVLEVMAGRGWLAKALYLHGVNVLATDDYSWQDKNGDDPVYPVKKMEAVRAIRKYRHRDVLLMSWPPYSTDDAVLALKAWGPDRPVVYVGEGYGGCNGDDQFHDLFIPDRPQPDGLWLPSWPGIHDYVTVGRLFKLP